MKSWKLGTIRNIPVLVHPSVIFLVALCVYFGVTELGFNIPNIISGVLIGLSLILSVLAHELGHAFKAQKFGVPCHNIVIFILGGAAKIELDRATLPQLIAIAMAGPAVNFLISLIFGVIYIALYLPFGIHIGPILFFSVINLIIGAFNLLPVYPLDGGRIFRATLMSKFGERKAALITLRVTQLMSLLMVVVAAILKDPCLLAFGLFMVLFSRRLVNPPSS